MRCGYSRLPNLDATCARTCTRWSGTHSSRSARRLANQFDLTETRSKKLIPTTSLKNRKIGIAMECARIIIAGDSKRIEFIVKT